MRWEENSFGYSSAKDWWLALSSSTIVICSSYAFCQFSLSAANSSFFPFKSYIYALRDLISCFFSSSSLFMSSTEMSDRFIFLFNSDCNYWLASYTNSILCSSCYFIFWSSLMIPLDLSLASSSYLTIYSRDMYFSSYWDYLISYS